MAKKWLKYPNGVEVVVREEDADEMRASIMARQAEQYSQDEKRGVPKDKRTKIGCEILDKPSYVGGHSDARERKAEELSAKVKAEKK